MNKKNIRQVGQPAKQKKIYIEDYVMTFLKQICGLKLESYRMAVLIGELGKENGETRYQIEGAVQVQAEHIATDYSIGNETWAEIYENIRKYFGSAGIIGWFLAGEGLQAEGNDWILKMHRENFLKEDRLLLVYDTLDHEEICYLYEDGRLKRQGGYYIFYKRNEAMQNYMVEQKSAAAEAEPLKSPEKATIKVHTIPTEQKAVSPKETAQRHENDDWERGRESLPDRKRDYKPETKIEARTENKPETTSSHTFYAVATFLALCVLFVSAISLRNYGKMSELEKSFKEVTSNFVQNGTQDTDTVKESDAEKQTSEADNTKAGSVLEVETVGGGVEKKTSNTDKTNKEDKDKAAETDKAAVTDKAAESEKAAESSKEAVKDKEPEQETKKAAETETKTKTEEVTKEPVKETSAKAEPVKYTVKSGDSLSKICEKYYNNVYKMDEVMKANNLTEADGILVGQVLILP